jgi:hypothetical protein
MSQTPDGTPEATAQGRAPGAVRLIFEYEGDTVRLVSQQPVDVVISGFDAGDTANAGHFVETRRDDGTRLARVAARGAFASSAEVFPEDHSEPIVRVEAPSRGAFTVVVPAAAEAAAVAVVRAAAGGAQAPGGPGLAPGAGDVDLGVFPLEGGAS